MASSWPPPFAPWPPCASRWPPPFAPPPARTSRFSTSRPRRWPPAPTRSTAMSVGAGRGPRRSRVVFVLVVGIVDVTLPSLGRRRLDAVADASVVVWWVGFQEDLIRSSSTARARTAIHHRASEFFRPNHASAFFDPLWSRPRSLTEQLGELKLGELVDTPPPRLDEAIAISKVMKFLEAFWSWPCRGGGAPMGMTGVCGTTK